MQCNIDPVILPYSSISATSKNHLSHSNLSRFCLLTLCEGKTPTLLKICNFSGMFSGYSWALLFIVA